MAYWIMNILTFGVLNKAPFVQRFSDSVCKNYIYKGMCLRLENREAFKI